jgi:hypothetical protein
MEILAIILFIGVPLSVGIIAGYLALARAKEGIGLLSHRTISPQLPGHGPARS